MKHKHITPYLLLAMVTLSCTTDRLEPTTEQITLPIEVYTSHPSDANTRGTANPGIDDELPAPTHLYVWMWARLAGGDSYFFDYRELDTSANGQWTYSNNATASHDARWCYNTSIRYDVAAIDDSPTERECRVYAIASRRALDIPAELKANTSVTRAGVPALVLDLSTWTPTDVRDLYSSPQGMELDYANESFGTLRLYHCAAKLDFQWEVAKALQPTTWVNQITVKQLPTLCKVFDPTHNPTTSCNATVTLTTDMSTRWIGRAYTFALQPADGTLTYDVDLEGKADISGRKTTDNGQQTTDNGQETTDNGQQTTDTTFTTWYREIATIEE